MKKGKLKNIEICTLGSHCSLQVLKGAKDENLSTSLICEKKRYDVYRRYSFIDRIILVDSYTQILQKSIQQRLKKLNSIFVPHGTLISYLSSDEIEGIDIPFFGNRYILRWEADRNLKEKLMIAANLKIPRVLRNKEEIDRLCIVKLHGAAGGRGYFTVWDKKSFDAGLRKLKNSRLISSEKEVFIQEYIQGVPVFLHYFYSPRTNELEFMGVDRRYESDVDGISRIPAKQQLNINVEPTYNVIGNIPLVLRESLLEEVYKMGEKFVNAAKKLVPPGIPGPFCLEGVYTEDGTFTTFEFSARIVAGTNLYVSGSSYSELLFGKEMSMGRRIASEIKVANFNNQLNKILT